MTQRLAAFVLYVLLLLTVVWAGGAALGFAADYHFYHRFLAPWHQALQTYRRHGGGWPEFDNNHVPYMLELTQRVRDHTGFTPVAGGRGAFMYRLDRPGAADQHVLVLGLPERMVVYGLQRSTARRVDRFAEGTPDLASGALRGRPGSRAGTTIVTWSY